MNTVKLAEALLRRKELQGKVDRIGLIKETTLFEVKARRIRVTDSIDDVTATVPKVELNQVTKEYDFYARQLREVDAAIQNANWTTELQLKDNNMQDYKED